MEFKHTSVLLKETIEALNIVPGGVYLDGTLGGGGHAFEVCKKLNDNGRLYGIDQDADAIKAAGNDWRYLGKKQSSFGIITVMREKYLENRVWKR